MRTVVGLANSNCPWCLDSTIRQLRDRRAVTGVRAHSSAGCFVVDHADDDPTALVAQIRRDLRAVEVASNGELVMSLVAVEEAPSCGAAHPDPMPRTAQGMRED